MYNCIVYIIYFNFTVILNQIIFCNFSLIFISPVVYRLHGPNTGKNYASSCFGCGMPAGSAYPSGHLVPSPILGLANAPIVETRFLELAMSLLDFSHRIPLGTFSILLQIRCKEKKEEIRLSPVTKTPTPTEQSKKQRDNIKTPPKTLITQLLRTHLGRSVGVTAVTQLVWLNRFTSAQPSH